MDSKPENNFSEIQDNKSQASKENAKKWKLNNAENIKEYNKKYYSEHKDVYKTKYQLNQKCECGGVYNNGTNNRHINTLKHRFYVLSKNLAEN